MDNENLRSGQQQPYVGPRAFKSEDASLFFGRSREAEELLALILAHPVILLYAPSGAGKTSLLQAKVISLLRTRSDQVFGPARVGGEISHTQGILNIFVFNALTSLEKETRSTVAIKSETLWEYLSRQPAPEPSEDFSPRRVIILDQFEEIFTSYPERWRDRSEFFDQIGDSLDRDPHLRVVFAMREEYIASLDPYTDRLPERLQTRFRLEPLRKKPAKLAVTGPLTGTGRSFTSSAVDKLVENLLHIPVKSADGMSVASGEFIEPLHLQIVCQRLWRSVPEDIQIIDENYIRDFGDVDQALAHYYESCLDEVIRKCNADEARLRSWFESALITSEGTRGLVYRDKRTTREIPNKWVDMLESLHLIRAEMRSGARWYELIHDRFINPIHSSNAAWEKQKTRSYLSDVEVEEWIRIRAFKQGEVRRLTAKLGRPERLWHKLLEDPSNESEGVFRDWQTAELVLTLDVLEGRIRLSGKSGPRTLQQLEREWLSTVKRTKAYLLWEDGNASPDDSRHQSDYYRACEDLRKRLVDPEIKSPVEEFRPVEEYLRSRYLDSRGRFDEHKPLAKALLAQKAYRISETSETKDADQDWFHACDYAEMFYSNILQAAKDQDEESILITLKAFQYSKAPEHRYLIINCLEAAIAIYFLDAAIIRKLWKESKESTGAEPYTMSRVTLDGEIVSWSPPKELASRLSLENGVLTLRGMLRQRELLSLLKQAPSAWAPQIEDLYRHSRLLPEKTTL